MIKVNELQKLLQDNFDHHRESAGVLRFNNHQNFLVPVSQLKHNSTKTSPFKDPQKKVLFRIITNEAPSQIQLPEIKQMKLKSRYEREKKIRNMSLCDRRELERPKRMLKIVLNPESIERDEVEKPQFAPLKPFMYEQPIPIFRRERIEINAVIPTITQAPSIQIMRQPSFSRKRMLSEIKTSMPSPRTIEMDQIKYNPKSVISNKDKVLKMNHKFSINNMIPLRPLKDTKLKRRASLIHNQPPQDCLFTDAVDICDYMLKVITREVIRGAHVVKRLGLMYERKTSYQANEPNEIVVHPYNTEFRLKANDVDSYQDAINIYNFVNLKKSKGNYIVDADNNIMLDLVGNENNPLGYNHEAFQKNLNNKEFDTYIINSNLTSNEVAPKEFFSLVDKSIGQIAPKKLPAVTLTHFRSGLEKALMTAMAEREQPNAQVLGFKGTYGIFPSFALQQFTGRNSAPSLNWPMLDYPSSQSEESATLEQVRSTFRSSSRPIAAVTIQPVQCGTGLAVSQDFLSQLYSIAKENGAAFVVDEQSTVLSTGRGYFAYEGEADYVVFGKKTQASGFFSKVESKQFTNCSGGESHKLLAFKIINDVVQKEQLNLKVAKVGKAFKEDLKHFANKKTGITSITGEGTHLYLNTQNEDTADKLWGHLISNGVITKRNSGRGVMIKPSLLLDTKHTQQFIQVLSGFRL